LGSLGRRAEQRTDASPGDAISSGDLDSFDNLTLGSGAG
jgi:hypothetical protein